jgi:hypothetical protein
MQDSHMFRELFVSHWQTWKWKWSRYLYYFWVIFFLFIAILVEWYLVHMWQSNNIFFLFAEAYKIAKCINWITLNYTAFLETVSLATVDNTDLHSVRANKYV